MQQSDKIVFLGGDERSCAMAERLSALGFEVRAYALGAFDAATGIETAASLDAALEAARAIVLPMPAFDAHLRIPCLRSEQSLPAAAELFARIGGRLAVFGGRVSPAVFALAAEHAVNISDYAVSEEVQIRNAIPTAEGAIALAMQALDITLHGARVAVLGFGRIGFALATRLRALGSQVTVAARRPRDVARIEGECCRALHLGDERAMRCLIEGGYDVIFNTVPYRLITDEDLARIPSSTVLIELASAPGGWDPSAAAACRTIYAPGLPGKCAPRTAGCILADALATTLEEVMRA